MRYRVFWNPDAERELESVTRKASNPAEIATCVRNIDRILIRHPKQFGESREEQYRVAFESPLAILFEVFDDERTVVVYRLWRYA